MAKKKPPPAKIKYDQAHPIVSVRVTQDLKKQLDEMKEMSGKSVGDILREAVGVQKLSVKSAFTRGYNKGKKVYAVWYKCSVCGGDILVESDKEKKAAAQYMREHKWAHGKCLNK